MLPIRLQVDVYRVFCRRVLRQLLLLPRRSCRLRRAKLRLWSGPCHNLIARCDSRMHRLFYLLLVAAPLIGLSCTRSSREVLPEVTRTTPPPTIATAPKVALTPSPPAPTHDVTTGERESTLPNRSQESEQAVVIDVVLDGAGPFVPFLPSSSGALNRLVLPATYAELVRADSQGQYQPLLAEEIPSLQNGLIRFTGIGENRQLEVEFPLRRGLVWHDGRPLTAEDLAFSWEFVMSPDWPGSHFVEVGPAPEIYVSEVEAAAADRVIYRFMSERQAREAARSGGRLNQPELYEQFGDQLGPVVPVDLLAVARNVFPRHWLEAIPAEGLAASEFARRPIYAGPYRIVAGGLNWEQVVLESFSDFALGEPQVKRLIFGAKQEAGAPAYWMETDVLLEALQTGGVQAQLGVPAMPRTETAQAYDALADAGVGSVFWSPRDSIEVLDFNLDNPHLAQLEVRQAIAHALDREGLIQRVLEGKGESTSSYLPRWHPLYPGHANLPEYMYDPDKARSLLQSAGYDLTSSPAAHPIRGPLVLNLASMDVAPWSRPTAAELIAHDLLEVGVAVRVEFYDRQDFEGTDCSAVRNGRRFDLAIAGWLGLGRLPVDWIRQTTATLSIPTVENGCPFEKSNWPGWSNERVDALISELEDGELAVLDPDSYRQRWAEHQRIWAEELPSLVLFNWYRPVVAAPSLIGLKPSPFHLADTWNVWEWLLK